MPSSNGVGSARALARLYAATAGEVDGIRLLRPETLLAARQPLSQGPDRVIFLVTCFASGFSLPPMLPPICGPAAFGHSGAGGSLAFADPDTGLAFAYVMNQMRFDPAGDPRALSLVRSLYDCLA
jgi:CubicO group peptidase (beta-lactamase class C family)